jgi:glycosyltransferase involved in cell wall biosynthesis
MRVLIVTPEVGGTPGVGGVGTFVYHLSRVLSLDNSVSILSTDATIGAEEVSRYRSYGIEVINFPIWEQSQGRLSQSRYVFEYLLENFYDHVIFSDWAGAAYFSLNARRANLLKKTSCTVVAHGCTTWAYIGLKQFLSESDPLEHIIKVSLERKSMELADYLVSPSDYMRSWTNGYLQTSEVKNRIVLKQPYFLENGTAVRSNLGNSMPTFTFFGRLEERKGLRLFVNAIIDFHSKYSEKPRVHIIGKPGWMKSGEFGNDFVVKEFNNSGHNIEFEIFTNLRSDEAIEQIRGNNSLVVIPSQLDNAPYTVIESIVNGFKIVSIKTGGIPEYLPEAHISENNKESLSRKMYEFAFSSIDSIQPEYDFNLANSRWRNFIADPSEFLI